MLASLLIAASYFFTASCRTVGLPTPPAGNVFITDFPLTDWSRIDPFALCCEPRRLMLSLFQPANCSQTHEIAYMSPLTAAFYDEAFATLGIPNGTFGAFRLKTCPSPPKNTNFPVLLFSTGAGTSRLLYNVLCQWVASMGFNVVSIDHSYDAPLVEFPDGTFIEGANITLPGELAQLVEVRADDVLSVLKALSNSNMTEKLGIPLFKTKRVGVFGHSLGGATAGNAMLLDPRLVGGLNMDGGQYGPSADNPQKNPFTIFAAQNHNQSNDDTWAAFWQELKGMKLQLQVNGTEHGSFTDYAVLANSIGINASANPAIEHFIGSVGGVRMMTILRSYIGGFFQEVLESKKVKLLQGPSPQFPEVSFTNMSLSTKNVVWRQLRT